MGGEPACCFVLSVLCFTFVLFLFLIFMLVLFYFFMLFVVLPVASPPGEGTR